jgi:hypothetical protein
LSDVPWLDNGTDIAGSCSDERAEERREGGRRRGDDGTCRAVRSSKKRLPHLPNVLVGRVNWSRYQTAKKGKRGCVKGDDAQETKRHLYETTNKKDEERREKKRRARYLQADYPI